MAFSHTSDQTATAVMELLGSVHPGLLARDEVRREVADQVGVDDALAHFERYGIVHRVASPDGTEYFWATRTAMAAVEAATADISGESGCSPTRERRLWR